MHFCMFWYIVHNLAVISLSVRPIFITAAVTTQDKFNVCFVCDAATGSGAKVRTTKHLRYIMYLTGYILFVWIWLLLFDLFANGGKTPMPVRPHLTVIKIIFQLEIGLKKGFWGHFYAFLFSTSLWAI